VRQKKICGAKQKSGLKPPPLVVDSPILDNFLLYPFARNGKGFFQYRLLFLTAGAVL